MERNKAIILDRDGVLNEDTGYPHKIEDFILLDGVIESLKRLKEHKFFIISNQSGIGRGYYTKRDFQNFNNHLLGILKKQGIHIEKTYFCPHTPEKNCDCRKPNIKFVRMVEKEFDIDLSNSWVLGDHTCDVLLGRNAGCHTIFLLTGHGIRHLKEVRKISLDYIAANIKQAADFILFDKEEKMISRESLKALVNELRKKNKKIVTINGAFDILHNGHEKILSEAKKQGDVLIVGVNSDSSVKENKGAERPVNNEINRSKMLANFDFVDYVTIFDEKTPVELLDIVKPDVHVNGSEYGEECIEAEVVRRNGGKIYIVDLLPGYSTTRIINNDKKNS